MDEWFGKVRFNIVSFIHSDADTKTYKNQSAQDTIKKYPTIIRWVLYYGLFYLILFERFIVETHFIYGGF